MKKRWRCILSMANRNSVMVCEVLAKVTLCLNTFSNGSRSEDEVSEMSDSYDKNAAMINWVAENAVPVVSILIMKSLCTYFCFWIYPFSDTALLLLKAGSLAAGQTSLLQHVARNPWQPHDLLWDLVISSPPSTITTAFSHILIMREYCLRCWWMDDCRVLIGSSVSRRTSSITTCPQNFSTWESFCKPRFVRKNV